MYQKQDFSHVLGTPGFSDKALELHFKLYGGYVDNTNKILEKLTELGTAGQTQTPEFAELKRRLGWEWNGMRLHEYFFPELSGGGKINPNGRLMKAIEKSFGTYDGWADDFVATAMTRGIGWAALYQDTKNGSLINFWINEHNVNHPAAGNLILILDVFEHAVIPDYGSDRKAFIDAFMKVINWDEVEKRLA